MILFEREQPFADHLVPLPCFIITEEEKRLALQDPDIRLQQRKNILDYLKTQILLEKIWVFEEDGVIWSFGERNEIYRQEHQVFCDSLIVIYQVPLTTNNDDLEKYNFYQINVGQDKPMPVNGLTLYRNGIKMAENIMSFNHAVELAYNDAVKRLEELKKMLEAHSNSTDNLLKLLEKTGLYSDQQKYPFTFIDESTKSN